MSGALLILLGTPQGAALSPFYFTIFIAEVGELIRLEQRKWEKEGELSGESMNQIWSLLFADDNKVAASLKNNADRVRIQATLDTLYKWIEENDMTINASKTYCLRVGRLETGEERYKAPGGGRH